MVATHGSEDDVDRSLLVVVELDREWFLTFDRRAIEDSCSGVGCIFQAGVVRSSDEVSIAVQNL